MSRRHRFRLWLLKMEADRLMRKANRPHVQSPHMIGLTPPKPASGNRPTGRYLLLILCVVLVVVYVNTSPSQAHDVCHVVSEK